MLPSDAARILVVDDDPEVLRGIQQVFERLLPAARVDAAASAEEAIPFLERHAYDVVVTDHWMPGRSGVELLALVRDAQPAAVRVLVTAAQETEVAVQAVNLGHVHAFVQKPWRATDLADRVARLLADRDARRREAVDVARVMARAARAGRSGGRV